MANNRRKKLAMNTMTSLLLQITQLISGFILPRLILDAFGSDVNGLVNSITQFLGVITLLDLGVGAVVQSALYKPLAEKDNTVISQIFVSATKFFKRLALILLIYVVFLCGIYPIFVSHSFGYIYTIALIIAICISSFAQYYFGIVNSLLLSADQKGYIQYTAQIVTIILNTIACAILIKLGGSIQIVKLTTSMIFLCRPLFLNWYVRKNYRIDNKITYEEEPIKQKWNGMAQHFASYVLNGTDNIVLTLFSTLANVSIYSVYNLVINGVFMIITSLSNGFSSYFGDLFARKEDKKLKSDFILFEWFMNASTILVFGCTSSLIVNFVKVYTKGIYDAEYTQPIFAIILTISFAVRAIRMPYNFLILAAGHYKQTQNNYIIAMILNIVISIITVKAWGLIGVSIGTLVAMFYQTIWMAWYDYKNLISQNFKKFVKLSLLDVSTFTIGYSITSKIPMLSINYSAWIVQAILVFITWFIIIILINSIFYKYEAKMFVSFIKRRIRR